MADVRQPRRSATCCSSPRSPSRVVAARGRGVTALLPREGQELVFHTPAAHRRARGRHGVRPVAHPPSRRRALTGRPMTDPPARPATRRRRSTAAPRISRASPTSPGTCWSSAAGSSAPARCSTRRRRGLRVALVEQDDIAVGHVVPVEPPDPRRAALPPAVPRRPRPRGARANGRACCGWRRTSSQLEEFLFPLYGPPVATRAFYDGRHDDVRRARAPRSRAGGIATCRPPATLEYAPDLAGRACAARSSTTTRWRTTPGYTLAVVRTALAHGRGSALAVDARPRDRPAPRGRPGHGARC